MDKIRSQIAAQVRELRSARRWTQAELARAVDLSQSRLSEVERGDGSFTAEQFLVILRLFNAAPGNFDPRAGDTEANIQNALQNALVRLGARQLRENPKVPGEEIPSGAEVVRQALVGGSARFVIALAPVLIENIDRLSLHSIHITLVDAGLERRMPWLVDNTLTAIRVELTDDPRWTHARVYRRAELLFETFLDSVLPLADSQSGPADVLDPTIRSRATLEEVRLASSPISRRWRIVTRLRPEDFVESLRAARVRR